MDPHKLHTSVGDFDLQEYRLGLGGREWSILHTGATLSYDDELRFLNGPMHELPYGVMLWPSSIALAHEIASRADEFRGKRILELGAGTGLPGIVAASFGARVVQTDRQELSLSVCKRNGARNGVDTIEYRSADWETWTDTERYDCILGADILYGRTTHPSLRHIFDANVAPGGRLLLSDPFRESSYRLLETMEQDGWRVSLSKWTIGVGLRPRPIGVFELTRLPQAASR